MNRMPLVVGCVLLTGCLSPVTLPPYVSDPDVNDFKAREDCLYRKVCTEIGSRGSSPIDLESAANVAGLTCQIPIAKKMRDHLVSTHVYIDWRAESNEEELLELEVEKHALVVAYELKDECTRRQ